MGKLFSELLMIEILKNIASSIRIQTEQNIQFLSKIKIRNSLHKFLDFYMIFSCEGLMDPLNPILFRDD